MIIKELKNSVVIDDILISSAMDISAYKELYLTIEYREKIIIYTLWGDLKWYSEPTNTKKKVFLKQSVCGWKESLNF